MLNIKLHITLLRRYLAYYLRAKTRYDVHLPFLFQLTEEVLEDERFYYAFQDIALLRAQLQQNHRWLELTDHGAGSLINGSKRRTIADLARNSAISRESGELLFRLVRFMQPKQMLEMGASLGISAAYQAAAAPRGATFITLEGCPQTAEEARSNLQQLAPGKIEVRTGPFEASLPLALKDLGRLDYLYLDGDHREGASLSYFNTCLPYAHDGSVFVIADIHWSAQMERAWEQLKQHPEVTLSVDLFHFGLLFFRKAQLAPQSVSLIKARYKPWRAGFFPAG